MAHCHFFSVPCNKVAEAELLFSLADCIQKIVDMQGFGGALPRVVNNRTFRDALSYLCSFRIIANVDLVRSWKGVWYSHCESGWITHQPLIQTFGLLTLDEA